MKWTLVLLSVAFSLVTHAAPMTAVVESSTGKLNQAMWSTCEAEVLSQGEETLQMKIKLTREKAPATFERTLNLTKDDLDFLFDIRWDFGFSEAPVHIAGTSFSNTLIHRVRDDGNQWVYRLWFVEKTDELPYATSELVCRFNKN